MRLYISAEMANGHFLNIKYPISRNVQRAKARAEYLINFPRVIKTQVCDQNGNEIISFVANAYRGKFDSL